MSDAGRIRHEATESGNLADMAEVFVPSQLFMLSPIDHQLACSTQPSVPRATERTSTKPNSPFVFPFQSGSIEAAAASETSLLSAKEQEARRSADRFRPQRLCLHALPAFDFNPSSPNDPSSRSSSCTPTRRTPPCSNVPAGHRRNGSEFIGGDSKLELSGSSGTCRTEGEIPLKLPSTIYNIPPASKRGHAHRRSGAVSSNDLSHVLKPTQEPRGNSLPTTPSDPNHRHRFPSHFETSFSQPRASSSSQDNPPIAALDENNRPSACPRARVGFSDTLEFIPRPLSTISSETSSSLSTVRGSHSVTGSISSIISGGNSTPPLVKSTRPSNESTFEQSATGDLPIAGTSTPKQLERGEVPEDDIYLQQTSNTSVASSQLSQTEALIISSKSTISSGADYTDFTIDEVCPDKEQIPPSAWHSKTQLPHVKPTSMASTLIRPRSSPEPKVGKGQKKVKSWADTFLPRKSRLDEATQIITGPVRATSPRATFALVDELTLEHISFDNDTTCVIRDLSQIPPLPGAQPGQYNTNGSDEDHIPSAVLDLDAQFNSINASSSGIELEDFSEGGFSAARRRMHSSGATGGFSGPGMHYHRRTESAPEMTQFDCQTLGFPRFGSNPKMADVFEEEEEAEDDQNSDSQDNIRPSRMVHRFCPSNNQSEEEISGLGVNIVDLSIPYGEHLPRRSCRPNVGSSAGLGLRSSNIRSEKELSFTRQKLYNVEMTDSPIEIVEADEEPRPSDSSKPSEDYVAIPTVSTKPVPTRPLSAPIDFAMPKADLLSWTPETLSSTMSSPDFSQASFDIPRLHTANSSITDRLTLNSCRAGEQSVNLRASVDDVPSLTSSASTAISAQRPRFSSSAYTRSSAERSPSLSAAVRSKTRSPTSSKRSSLANLSRLVGNSHAERTKLHIEEHAQLNNLERADKRKGHIISRLIRFWKPREKPARKD